jgi:two-component sensor histidine kinase
MLIVSELASNAIVHSASRGEFFTIRAELHADYVWVEAEDLGGPWRCRRHNDRPHGLDVVEALTGPDNWGTDSTSDGGRVVWARLDLAVGERAEQHRPPRRPGRTASARRITAPPNQGPFRSVH